jgi:hypothetical protein
VRLVASDVANFLACQRLTQLDLLRARGELRPPEKYDVGFDELVRRGKVHELSVLEADDMAPVPGAGRHCVRGGPQARRARRLR